MTDPRYDLVLGVRAEDEISAPLTKAQAIVGDFAASAEKSANLIDQAMGKAALKFGSFAQVADEAIAQVKGQFEKSGKDIRALANDIVAGIERTGQIDLNVAAYQQQAQGARNLLAVLEGLQQREAALIAERGTGLAQDKVRLASFDEEINKQRALVAQLEATAGAAERMQIDLQTSGVITVELAQRTDLLARAQQQAAASAERLNTAYASTALSQQRTSEATQRLIEQRQQEAQLNAAAEQARLNTAYASTALSQQRTSAATQRLIEQRQEEARQTRAMATEASYLLSQIDPLYAAQLRLNQLQDQANRLLQAGAISEQQYAAAIKFAHQQVLLNNSSTGAMRAGMQQLTFQINDVATQFAAGTPPMIIFAQQSSQVVQAVSLMAQESKGLLGVLGNPWVQILTAALVVLGPFVTKLFDGADAAGENAKAMDKVRLASAGLGDAQAVLGQMYDLATGRIKAQNEMLRLNLALQSAKLRAESQAAGDNYKQTRDNVGRPGFFDFGATRLNSPALQRLFGELDAGKIDSIGAIRRAQSLNYSGTGVTLQDVLNAISDRVSATFKEKTADRIDSTLSNGRLDPSFLEPKTKRGPSAETLARRAEALRQKELSEDSAYAEAERQARHRLLDAIGKTTSSEQQRDQLLRDDINAEAAANKRKIANSLSAGKISAAEAARLTSLEEQIQQQRLQNVDIARTSQTIREQADRAAHSLDNQLAMAQIEAEMALTTRERRDAEQRILDLRKQQEKAALQAIINDPLRRTSDRQQAVTDLGNLDTKYGALANRNNQQNAAPLEEYRTRLIAATKDIDAAFESVEANGLQSLEDGLVGVISGTESLGSAFKKMANQIIADLIRIGVQKAILGSITGGGVFSFLGFSGGGKVQGHATGGYISGPGTATSDDIPAWLSDGEYVLRAAAVRRVGVRALDALNSGQTPRFAAGGLVSPRLPVVRAGSSASGGDGAGGVTIQINAPGATAETVAMIRRELANAAPTIIQAAATNTARQMQRRKL